MYNVHIYTYIYIYIYTYTYIIYVYYIYIYISGDNTDQNGDCHLILGFEFGLKPKILLSYFLERKNYS